MATRNDTRITDIVDSREIWIVPMLNPDGAEYDMSGGVFRHWRKNRQPIPDSTAIGIDLNRNWGYKWGGVRAKAATGAPIRRATTTAAGRLRSRRRCRPTRPSRPAAS